MALEGYRVERHSNCKRRPDGRGIRLQLDHRFKGFHLMIRSDESELTELVFEGLEEITARQLSQEVLGRGVVLPTVDDLVDIKVPYMEIGERMVLRNAHVRVLRYGNVYDVEINFIPREAGYDLNALIEGVHGFAIRVANAHGVSSYFAGIEPACDEDTRYFTGAERGPYGLLGRRDGSWPTTRVKGTGRVAQDIGSTNRSPRSSVCIAIAAPVYIGIVLLAYDAGLDSGRVIMHAYDRTISTIYISLLLAIAPTFIYLIGFPLSHDRARTTLVSWTAFALGIALCHTLAETAYVQPVRGTASDVGLCVVCIIAILIFVQRIHERRLA